MKRLTTSFRIDGQALTALKDLADRSGKTRTQVLEWLIEREYRARVESGQIPPDQDLFDLFCKELEAYEHEKG